jgi:cell wall-associated NlpC family hydrolase
VAAQRSLVAAVAVVAGLFATVVMIPVIILGGGAGGTGLAAPAGAAQNAADTGGACTYSATKYGGAVAAGISLSASQLQIADAGVAVAKQRKLPAQASIDILAAGMQESTLTNLDHGDRDSLGWLQQRPSQGWGTPAQLMDPVYAAGKFLDRLARVPLWQSLPPAAAIQKVQISGDGSLYDKWVPMATALASSLLGDPSVALHCAPGGGTGSAPGQAPSPAAAAVLSRARGALGLPYCFDGGTGGGPSHGAGGPGCEGQTVGFDCSGLALYAWAGVGVPLDHYAASQYTSSYGHLIPLAQAQPGDLVFLSSDGSVPGIHHVAMMWSTSGKPDGSGQIIEAQDFNVPVHIRDWAGTAESEVMPSALRITVTR